MTYHNNNKFGFTQYFNTDGTCAATPTPPTPPADCNQTIGSGTIGAAYDPTSQMVTITAVIPDGSYAGWGWGSSMTDTEMVIFETGTSAGVSFYDGTGDTAPTEATSGISSCYTTTSTLDGTTYTLTATRPLDCSDVVADSYLIQLDTTLSLITAWSDTSSTLTYHDGDKFGFTQYFNSDGTCAESTPTDDCTQTIGSGTIGAVYDPTSQMVTITAVIPNTSYAGWGWGGSMTDTEMVIFETGSDLGVGYYYGTGDTTPTEEDSTYSSCYTVTSSVSGSTATLTATRPLECDGIVDSYVI